MAKFGADVTTLSPPDMGGAKHISAPVVDKSSVGALQFLGEQVVGAYKGYQLADLESEQEKAIDDYMARRGNADVAEQSQLEAAALDATRASLFLKGASEEEVDPITKQFQEKINRYELAVKQGVMSPEDLSTRVLTNLREAVNRNPGLFNELKEHSQKVLELSGVSAFTKLDAQAREDKIKSAQDYRKDLELRAREVNFSYTSTTPNYVLEKELERLEGDKRAHTFMQQQKERHAVIRAEDALKWVDTNGDAALRGAQDNAKNIALGIFQSNNTTDYAKVKFAIGEAYDTLLNDFVQSVPVSIRNEPIPKQMIADFEKSLKSSQERLAKLGSGEDARAVITNEYEILKAQQDKRLRESVDVSSLNLMGDIMRYVPEAMIKDSGVRQKFIAVTSQLASGNFSAPVVQEQLPKKVTDKQLSQVLSSTAALGKETKDFSGLNKLLDTYNQGTNNITDPTQKNLFLFNNLEALSKADLTGMDANGFSKVNQMVGNFLHDKQQGIGPMLTLMNQYKVKADVLPDGRLLFSGENAQQFNEKFGVKINIALQAYANAAGASVKEAAKKFYPDYLKPYTDASGLLTDPDITAPSTANTKVVKKVSGPGSRDTGIRPIRGLPGERLVIKNTEDLMRALQLGKITGAEFEAVARDMLLGKSQ